jgi:hypothetical protein
VATPDCILMDSAARTFGFGGGSTPIKSDFIDLGSHTVMFGDLMTNE